MNSGQTCCQPEPGDWVVYILRCADQSLYTGISNHFTRRLAQHQAGTASRYTKVRLPVEVVHIEAASDRGSATRREMEIKKLSRTGKLALFDPDRPS